MKRGQIKNCPECVKTPDGGCTQLGQRCFRNLISKKSVCFETMEGKEDPDTIRAGFKGMVMMKMEYGHVLPVVDADFHMDKAGCQIVSASAGGSIELPIEKCMNKYALLLNQEKMGNPFIGDPMPGDLRDHSVTERFCDSKKANSQPYIGHLMEQVDVLSRCNKLFPNLADAYIRRTKERSAARAIHPTASVEAKPASF